MRKVGLYITVILIIIVSCNNQKINEPNEDKLHERQEMNSDESLFRISDLPIHIDSTGYLFHPIGYVKERKKEFGDIYKSSQGKYEEFNLTRGYNDEITGDMSNLRFQKLNSSELNELTSENLKINRIKFLRNVFNNTKKKILLYLISDSDSNEDGKITPEDNESIYLSKINGDGFLKITKKGHKVIESKVIKRINRLYIKTIVEGEEKPKTKVHYFYVDLTKDNFKLTEYFPV